ncbi:hypothetical protein L208DRAFT_1418744 [Tricholoma matsutake]|nr:hypothetical protein L208DRAFT_1418744 [Tricholoma matsutake 945]
MTTMIPPPPPTQQPQSPEPAPDEARVDENWGNNKNDPRADRNNGSDTNNDGSSSSKGQGQTQQEECQPRPGRPGMGPENKGGEATGTTNDWRGGTNLGQQRGTGTTRTTTRTRGDNNGCQCGGE